MRTGAGARSALRSKWCPEKEKSKLVNRRREMLKIIKREETYPEATGDEGMPFRYPRIGIPGLAH
jgi:hypothetical protein